MNPVDRDRRVHVCECDACEARMSRAAIRNGVTLGGALWLMLIGITWGVLKACG